MPEDFETTWRWRVGITLALALEYVAFLVTAMIRVGGFTKSGVGNIMGTMLGGIVVAAGGAIALRLLADRVSPGVHRFLGITLLILGLFGIVWAAGAFG
jgi:hypothetical protein